MESARLWNRRSLLLSLRDRTFILYLTWGNTWTSLAVPELYTHRKPMWVNEIMIAGPLAAGVGSSLPWPLTAEGSARLYALDGGRGEESLRDDNLQLHYRCRRSWRLAQDTASQHHACTDPQTHICKPWHRHRRQVRWGCWGRVPTSFSQDSFFTNNL